MALKPVIKRSATIVAIVVFLAINVVITSLYQAGKNLAFNDTEDRANKLQRCVRKLDVWDEVSIESTVNQFHQLVKRANIVLMGSSLMMYPMFAVDKGREPQASAGLLQYHKAVALQTMLRHSGVPRARVYNLATPMQMISDTYFYIKTSLGGAHTPRMIVLGVAPRDFYDAESPAPGQSLNFSDQYNPFQSDEISAEYLANWQDQLAFEIRRYCILWDKRGYVQSYLTQKMMDQQHLPTMAMGTQFAFGLDKYKIHYQGISAARLQAQMTFLNKICHLCKERQIKLIVLNMPLPAINRSLLPAGFYSAYKERLRETLAVGSVKYIDLSDQEPFSSDLMFCDAAHMNLRGGIAFVDHLAKDINNATADMALSQAQNVTR